MLPQPASPASSSSFLSSSPPSPSSSSSSTTPSDPDLVTAITSLKSTSPNLGVLKVLECLRCQKRWVIGEKRLRKVMKDNGLTLDPNQCHQYQLQPSADSARSPDAPLSATVPLPIPIPIPSASSSTADNLQLFAQHFQNSSPNPRARGRLRTPKALVAGTSASASALAAAAAERDMDAWLPGGLKRVKIHLDLLPSLSLPPSHPQGRTHIFPSIRLHVMEDTLTGEPYVLAPEVCRAIWGKLDGRDAHLAHSMYSPAPHRCFDENPEYAEGEPRLLGCPQGLRRQRATFLGRRGDTEKIWVYPVSFPSSSSSSPTSPSPSTSPSSNPAENGKRKMSHPPGPVTREIRIELGAECHSDNPSKNPNPVISGKGKGRAVEPKQSKIITVKAGDLVKLTMDH